MSISLLSVFSNVSVCSAHLIISFHPSSDLLTTTTSRDRLFSPLVANQTVVHLRRRSILCNSPLHDVWNRMKLPDSQEYMFRTSCSIDLVVFTYRHRNI